MLCLGEDSKTNLTGSLKMVVYFELAGKLVLSKVPVEVLRDPTSVSES